jgi:hypothetical protein
MHLRLYIYIHLRLYTTMSLIFTSIHPDYTTKCLILVASKHTKFIKNSICMHTNLMLSVSKYGSIR